MIGDVLQPTHLIFILVVALLVLGPKRLPEVGRSLGKGIRDFRGAVSGITDSDPTPAPSEPADVQVNPITPATTAIPAEDSTSEPSSALAAQPAPTPVAVAESTGLSDPDQPASSLLPHVEPDESQPVAPTADPNTPS